MMLDRLKDLGFKYSTISGITFSIMDIMTSQHKQEYIAAGQEKVNKINKQFQRGLITDRERLELVIDIWTKAKEEIQDELQGYAKSYVDNPIFIMMNSKARGSISNFVQLAGMRGLMAKPNGETIEIPILSNFSEGLSVSEFFLSSTSLYSSSLTTVGIIGSVSTSIIGTVGGTIYFSLASPNLEFLSIIGSSPVKNLVISSLDKVLVGSVIVTSPFLKATVTVN